MKNKPTYEKRTTRLENEDGTKRGWLVEYVGNGWVSSGEHEDWKVANAMAQEGVAKYSASASRQISAKVQANLDRQAYESGTQAERDAHDNL